MNILAYILASILAIEFGAFLYIFFATQLKAFIGIFLILFVTILIGIIVYNNLSKD